MLEQYRLDFAGVDVLAAADDHVLDAIANEEEVLAVAIPDISGPQIPIAKGPRGFFGVVPVAAHDIATSDDELAGLPHRYIASGFIDHAHVDTGRSASAGRQPRIAVFVVLKDGEETGFAHPVSLLQ